MAARTVRLSNQVQDLNDAICKQNLLGNMQNSGWKKESVLGELHNISVKFHLNFPEMLNNASRKYWS